MGLTIDCRVEDGVCMLGHNLRYIAF